VFHFSELTKAEVFRAVRRTHVQRQPSEVLAWWDSLRFVLLDYREVPMTAVNTGEFSNLALNFPIQKNAQDYLHLITAKGAGLAFITSDKLGGQLDDLKRDYYTHIYYWPNIRDRIPIQDIFRH
jgi:hypothetical protein